MAPNGFLDDARQIAPPRALRIDFDDGSFALRSPVALRPYARCVGEWLERWVDTPTQTEGGPEGGWAGRLADHRHPVAGQGSGRHAGDVLLQAELAEAARGAAPRRQLPAAVECDGR